MGVDGVIWTTPTAADALKITVDEDKKLANRMWAGEISQERLSIAGGSYVVIRKDEHEIIAKRTGNLRCDVVGYR
eukprot:UN14627